MRCSFEGVHGQCTKLGLDRQTDRLRRCLTHASVHCVSCERPAVMQCRNVGKVGFCGAPLCRSCVHMDDDHFPLPPSTDPEDMARDLARMIGYEAPVPQKRTTVEDLKALLEELQ